jgi:hypothetical protein
MAESINSKANNGIAPARLSQLFEALWPQLQVQLAAIPAKESVGAHRDLDQVLEELVISTRRMESQLSDLSRRVAIAFGQRTQVAVPNPNKTPRVARIMAPRGSLPRFPQSDGIKLSRCDDIVEECARVSGLDINDYGKTWQLRQTDLKSVVQREEGRRLAKDGMVQTIPYTIEFLDDTGTLTN